MACNVPLEVLVVQLQEIIDYYNFEPRGSGRLKKLLATLDLNNLVLNYQGDGFIITGIYNIKENKPLFPTKSDVIYTCLETGLKYCVKYKIWIKKKLENRFISPSVSRSNNLSKLNKTKIRDANINSYKTEKGIKRKEQYRKQRIFFNKNIMPEIMKTFSDEKKQNIAIKKKNTFYKKSEEERFIINKKRNMWLYMDDEQKEIMRARISTTLLLNSEKMSIYMKDKWNNYSYDKKIELLDNRNHGFIKKMHPDIDIYYQGSLEKNFIDSCLKEGLTPKRGPNIEYYDPIENKIKIYMIDYEINNFLVEIKSLWWWVEHERINILKKDAAETYVVDNGYKAYILYIIDQKKDKKGGFDLDKIKS